MRFQPSIASILANAGVSIPPSKLPNMPTKPYCPEVDTLIRQFEAWFRHIDKSGFPATFAYKHVKETGHLTINDAIVGCLEAKYLDDRQGKRNEWNVTTNDLVGLVTELKFEYNALVKPLPHKKITKFCQELITDIKNVNEVDTDISNIQFMLFYDGRKYRFRPFGLWDAAKFEKLKPRDGTFWLARSNTFQHIDMFGVGAISELESLINSDASEYVFQKFFENNPTFLLALGNYKRLHPQIVLSEENGSRLIPDFFMEKLDSDFCDICDLKRPTQDLVRYQTNRFRFRDAIHEAIAQLALYRYFFEDRFNRNAFRSKYDLDAYRPNVVIIIGRSRSFYQEVDRIRLESGLPNWVQLKTYDDIVSKARQWMQLVSRSIGK